MNEAVSETCSDYERPTGTGTGVTGPNTESQPASDSSDDENYKAKVLKRMKEARGIRSTAASIDEEIQRYLNSVPLVTQEENDNPLLFWKRKEVEYPTLAKGAKQFLTMNCSSVAVESMFSTTGLVVNSRRSSLEPCRLNYISFIHDNIKFMP